MARPWRLRHKLLLGLALVTTVLGTLLTGSVQGLTSYVATMKTADSKLSELQFAEDLRAAIGRLTAPGEPTDPKGQEPLRMRRRLEEVRETLRLYEERHADTVRRQRDPDDGFQEGELVGAIRTICDEFEQAVQEAAGPRIVDNGVATLADDAGVRAAHAQLARAAEELRKAIYDDMYRRISIARTHQRRSMFVVITCSSAATCLLAGILYFFYGSVFYPIRRLQQGVDKLASGEFQPIGLKTGDELEELAGAFDEMAMRVQATRDDLVRQVNERSRQLVRSERLVSVGFLAAGVAHEINNPLASIAFCAEGLLRRLPDIVRRYPQEAETIQKYLEMIQSEAFRCKEITQNLLEFSRVGERRREPTDVAGLVQSVLEMAQLLPSCANKNIYFQPQAYPIALINGQDVKSVVLNLVVNALDSMDDGGALTIHLRQVGSQTEIIFQDTGCGMEADMLENIFEPFFTRSRTGKGTGLGLFISHQIIAQHDGTIEARSEGPGRGSVFIVRLPLQPAATTPSAPSTPPAVEGPFGVWTGNVGTADAVRRAA